MRCSWVVEDVARDPANTHSDSGSILFCGFQDFLIYAWWGGGKRKRSEAARDDQLGGKMFAAEKKEGEEAVFEVRLNVNPIFEQEENVYE